MSIMSPCYSRRLLARGPCCRMSASGTKWTQAAETHHKERALAGEKGPNPENDHDVRKGLVRHKPHRGTRRIQINAVELTPQQCRRDTGRRPGTLCRSNPFFHA